ncbi:MAG TPA: HAMP domain-containing sensor histidine kinase [Pseudonocardiaceae bacterium]|nr:HAMP domain-containing sensor histidine kinase [Pseudonocardiaceae bacterium]
MTRRIALALTAVTIVLLVAGAVPLGLSMTARERLAFVDSARAAARMIASAAEEYLSDRLAPDAMHRELADAQRNGDCAAVFDDLGRLVARTTCPLAGGDDQRELVAEALKGSEPEPPEDTSRLVIAEPVGEFRRPVGAVVLDRSLAPLGARVVAIWGWITLIGAGGLVASVVVSTRLARWVGQPLSELDDAARRLGEGTLGERARVDAGPPEVRRLAATFNTMAARIEALVHGHQAVIADVSHQLRTPLTALRLRLDVLHHAADDITADEIAAAQYEVARLSRLVDGLLAVARAEQVVPQPVPVRVDQIATDRVSAWEPVAHEHAVRLTARCAPVPPAALGAGHLEQILDNLLANALDAVAEGGKVTVESTTDRNVIMLRVIDDGPGMSPDIKASAFRRFGNPEARGSGLGLAIVHRLVTANGGTVQLADTPGGGLTAIICLPLWRGPRGNVSEATATG